MIIAERRLDEVFTTLPDIPGKGSDPSVTPKFDFGSHEDLMRFLNDKAKSGNYPYPLIWLETPQKSKGGDTVRTFQCTLILATLTKASFTSRQRLEKTIEFILEPLFENIIIGLEQSGITRILDRHDYETEIFYNYGDNNNTETQGSDIWDAIRFSCNIEINGKCIRTINYNIT